MAYSDSDFHCVNRVMTRARLWGILLFKRFVAASLTAVFMLAGLAPAYAAETSTPGCDRLAVSVDVSYQCTGEGIDLSALTDATEITVQSGGIVNDWTALASIPRLRVISVIDGTNKDVAGISNIPPTVQFVNLGGAGITDLGPLSGINLACTPQRCESELWLNVPGVTNLAPLSGINAAGCTPGRCVKSIFLAPGLNTTDFSPLGKIPALSRLTVLAYQDQRVSHVLGSTFSLPRIVGLNGSVVNPVASDIPLHTFSGPLLARATVYREGWLDRFTWSLQSTAASTELAANKTVIISDIARTYEVTILAMRGDLNGDKRADILARDSSGALWLYPGNGRGSVGTRSRIGAGWNAMSAISSAGDFNADNKADVLARDRAGNLWLYPGNGRGTFLPRARVGSGWNIMTAIVGPGDFNFDGKADVIARDSSGALWLYPGNGAGGFQLRTRIGGGWNVMTAIVGGDYDRDHKGDLVARDNTGKLWLYRANGKGGFQPRVQTSSAGNSMTAIAGPGDFNGDVMTDIFSRDSSGTLWRYSNPGGYPRIKIGVGWNVMNAIL
ncbi:FG-GAP repeat domain-containing protein [Arthrobacter globiformis]|uniref:VCBS repeat-containing protein n=1 Tax=Arthrobacter globiformis TaxID=1665 RepID=A0A328HJD3_ARTGO|nr:VCBS repeat-containing protein [Arthrobacter globiformis]RAM38304.1 hypothetical protein DBZ45_04630 [Arthrobacter globiformis]